MYSKPSALISVIILSKTLFLATVSNGKKSIATAYSPDCGKVIPSILATFLKNLSGIDINRPAPSPVSGSDPVPPR